MDNQEKTAKIKEIKSKFLAEVRRLEKWRDEQVKVIKKAVDQRQIDKLTQKLKQ